MLKICEPEPNLYLQTSVRDVASFACVIQKKAVILACWAQVSATLRAVAHTNALASRKLATLSLLTPKHPVANLSIEVWTVRFVTQINSPVIIPDQSWHLKVDTVLKDLLSSSAGCLAPRTHCWAFPFSSVDFFLLCRVTWRGPPWTLLMAWAFVLVDRK